MEKLKLKNKLKVVASALVAMCLVNCGGAGESTSDGGASAGSAPPRAQAAQQYAGSGSDWTWSLNADGTFIANEYTSPTEIRGTYSRLASGFLKLTVAQASGQHAPMPGEEAYGLEIPGVALLVKPLLSFEREIITMVAKGSCPSADFMSNYINTQHDVGIDMADPTKRSFGTFTYHHNEGYSQQTSLYAVQDFTALGPDPDHMTGSCSNGIMQLSNSDGSSAKAYLTAVGGAVVKNQNSNAGAFVLPKLHIPAQADLAGQYAGMIFTNDGGSSQVRPMVATVAADGRSITADAVVSVDNPVADGSASGVVSLDNVNQPEDGFVTGLVRAGLTRTGQVACMVVLNAVNTGKTVIACVGQGPRDIGERAEPYNLILVSK